ncbi:MAG: sporulation protein YunB [Oscillospiraceae bacterium]|nr:sporulation protein YunB [Oscillospiraceae bacterium]
MKNRHKFLRVIFILTLILIIILFFTDLSLRPLIKKYVEQKGKIESTAIVNKVVLDEISNENVDYTYLIKTERSNDGKVLSLSSNIQQINILKSKILLAIQNELSNTSPKNFGIPVGSFSGSHLLDNRGPEVILKLSICGNVSANFNSIFTDAGFNQTRHQIFLDITTQILAFIPGYPVMSGITTNILIAETIIVGEVPQILATVSDNNILKSLK